MPVDDSVVEGPTASLLALVTVTALHAGFTMAACACMHGSYVC